MKLVAAPNPLRRANLVKIQEFSPIVAHLIFCGPRCGKTGRKGYARPIFGPAYYKSEVVLQVFL
jgi:hypothetical protein